jgi:hypothetical protein
VNFGLDFGTTDIKTSAGDADIYVTKINANGSYGWTKIMGGTLYDWGYMITTNSSGNVYVTGGFGGTVNFGLDFGTTDNKTSAGGSDIFITKINANGTYGWTKIMGGTSDDGARGITTDSSDNVYVTGYFFGTVNFGLDFGATDNKTSAGARDIFIAKINANGSYGWTKIMGGTQQDMGQSITTDSSGNVYATGAFRDVVNFGLDFGTTDTKTSAGDADTYVIKLIPARGFYVLDGYGGVHKTGSAPALSPATPFFGFDIAKDLELTSNGLGYYVLDGYGGVHSGGAASSLSPTTPYFGWNIARDLELTPDSTGYYVLDGYGGIHKGGSAPSISPTTPYFGWNIVRDLELTSNGYYVLDGYGGVHKAGSAPSLSPATPYFGFDIAKDLELTSNGLGYYVLDGYGGVHNGGNAPSLTPASTYFGWNIARALAILR